MRSAQVGEEWIVDALGCDRSRIADLSNLKALLALVVLELDLHPLSDGFWHVFPGPGGITGFVPLRESHLAVHTYPEREVATLNLYCCHGGCEWDWPAKLSAAFGAQQIYVRRVDRGLAPAQGCDRPIAPVEGQMP